MAVLPACLTRCRMAEHTSRATATTAAAGGSWPPNSRRWQGSTSARGEEGSGKGGPVLSAPGGIACLHRGEAGCTREPSPLIPALLVRPAGDGPPHLPPGPAAPASPAVPAAPSAGRQAGGWAGRQGSSRTCGDTPAALHSPLRGSGCRTLGRWLWALDAPIRRFPLTIDRLKLVMLMPSSQLPAGRPTARACTRLRRHQRLAQAVEGCRPVRGEPRHELQAREGTGGQRR